MHEHEKWLLYALEDLNMAKLAILPNYMMVRSALYHAQQCAEKTLKAYIICRTKKLPPRTHDLSGLITVCATFDNDFIDLCKDAEDINPFSTATRYPEDAYMYPDVNHAHIIIEKANNIYNFVCQKIRQ
jgi:HEPN domain-containing protein